MAESDARDESPSRANFSGLRRLAFRLGDARFHLWRPVLFAGPRPQFRRLSLRHFIGRGPRN